MCTKVLTEYFMHSLEYKLLNTCQKFWGKIYCNIFVRISQKSPLFYILSIFKTSSDEIRKVLDSFILVVQ